MATRRICLGFSLCLTLVPACTKSEGPEPASRPPVFGGEGAVVTKEQPLPPESPAAVDTGPCKGAAPPGDTALFDDFEDGNHQAFKSFEREGWWWSASDPTPEAKISPPKDKFAPERLGAEGSKDNLFAAHFSAEGQKGWGAVWGSSVAWTNGGIKCPFNASAFGGLSLRAKGKGPVRMQLGLPETIGADGGGSCKLSCYDSHGKVLFLTEQWQELTVPWEKLQQEGWGAQARFDPARLIQLSFKVAVQDLPVDFWIDDITFIAKPGAGPKAR